jgi:hypothetical protein
MGLALETSHHDKDLWGEWVENNPAVVFVGESRQQVNAKLSAAAFAGKFAWPVLGGDSVQHAQVT